MTVIQEDALRFTFDADTQAYKYDDWAFYRNQFQNGCYRDNKAVDILCHSGHTAWLIEIKDYRQHYRTKAVDLADEIAVKVRDTMAGLVAAQIQANDKNEKGCAQTVLRKKAIRVVCHIEQPTNVSRLRPLVIDPAALKQKLRTLLKAIDPHPMVMDAASIPSALPWRVA